MTDGWFERNMFSELAVLLPIVAMIVFGTLYATTYPVLATISIAVAMQQAGWLGHDMTHAKDSYYCDTMLGFTSGFINGFNREWWSAKHNTHHVMTNHVGVDPDIDLMPASASFHNLSLGLARQVPCLCRPTSCSGDLNNVAVIFAVISSLFVAANGVRNYNEAWRVQLTSV
jgi:fatty acid desaturase